MSFATPAVACSHGSSLFFAVGAMAQTATEIDRMPVGLESCFALSAMPQHIRNAASVFVLDPEKGYELVRKGTSG